MKYESQKGGSFILNRNHAHPSTKIAQILKNILKICTARTLSAPFLLLLSAGAASATSITVNDRVDNMMEAAA